MSEVDFADSKELRAAINVAAGHRNALDGQLVDIARWLLTHDSWQGEGLTRPERYLAFRCGLTTANARRYVAVAERADELPESVDALRSGELALDQLMPIIRKAPSWADQQVLSLAKRLTVGQINSMLEKYDFERSGPPGDSGATESETLPDLGSGPNPEPGAEALPAPDDPDRTSHAPDADSDTPPAPPTPVVPVDRCWFGVGDDGRWRMHIETSPEAGKTIGDAIRERRDDLTNQTGELVSDVEALVDACQRSLDGIESAARRDRFRTNVHLDIHGRPLDELGRTVPEAIRRHITCDGLLSPVFVADGVPISVGRTQRIVPERTRKTVLLRDGGCRVPGCGATQHLEIHHIIHWSDGGRTDTWNLVALCAHHHRLHHHGRITISGNADQPGGLRIANAHGIDMFDDGARPEPPGAPPPQPEREYQPPLGERLDMNWVSFTHPDRLKLIAEQAREHARRHHDDREHLYRQQIVGGRRGW